MPVLNRRSPYRNWRLDQSFSRGFTVNRDTWQYDGLVGLWTCFGQNRNIVALPDEIQHRDMTAFNTPTITSSELGPVVLFDDASNEYLRVDSPVVLDEPLTMASWFIRDANATMTPVSVGAAGGGYWRITINGFGAFAAVAQKQEPGFTTGLATSTSGTTAGRLHQATAIFAADASRTIYLDGANQATDNTDIADFTAATTSIGCLYRGGIFNPFSGEIIETRIYNRILSAAEAFALWAPSTRWDLYKPTARAFFMGPTVVIRTPRYGFTNFQIPGIV